MLWLIFIRFYLHLYLWAWINFEWILRKEYAEFQFIGSEVLNFLLFNDSYCILP